MVDDPTHGPDTAGTLVRYFDGSTEALTRYSERITGASVDPASTELTLTTRGWFRVPGATGKAGDPLACTPGTAADNLADCTYQRAFAEPITKTTNGVHTGGPRSLSPVNDPEPTGD